ncbi:mannose-6-phosphate isomerase, class I [Arthrobacter sp. H41]|uniref:mannose-6-phosphate isomerase, class I n=1 Tax=Arthrobacter sp. H41 TaxID=1312978 RepID=UPI00047E603D|nr:mannose-6-phosphate isomerase, class I [Arthrobacter sp. H41]
MYLLDNPLRPYAWGSVTAIADLLGREPSGGPEAELWIGAHPGFPSVVLIPDGTRTPLDELIEADPAVALGGGTESRFGARLPFLLKVLAAESALSLQVHPSLDQAAAGYDAEEAAGIPADAAHRNYKDRNHKPEMLFALTRFDALCGFRPLEESAAVFGFLAGLCEPGSEEAGLLGTVATELGSDAPAALRNAFEALLSADSGVVASVEGAVASPRGLEPNAGDFADDLATVVELGSQYPGDAGVLVALLLNRVSLQPGEVIHLPAGNIHAYLSGLAIEVMASSDNVLRGGLTGKYVDVPELLRTVIFEPLAPPSVPAVTNLLDQELYLPPYEEFQLQRVVVHDGVAPVPLAQNGPAVVLVVSGSVRLDSPKSDLSLHRGQSGFLPDIEQPVLVHPVQGADSPAVLFAVTCGTPAGREGFPR